MCRLTEEMMVSNKTIAFSDTPEFRPLLEPLGVVLTPVPDIQSNPMEPDWGWGGDGPYVLTTARSDNGAIAILYEGVKEKIYELIGEYVILPSSIHELIIIPYDKDNVTPFNVYLTMVRSINKDKDVIEQKDVLSDNIFFYDGEKITMISE